MGNFTATVCLRLQTLPMSDQNSWFYHVYGRGGGGRSRRVLTISNELVPETHEEYPEVKCFALWTTHCFTKRL